MGGSPGRPYITPIECRRELAAVLAQEAQGAFRHDADADRQAIFVNIEYRAVMRAVMFVQLRAQRIMAPGACCVMKAKSSPAMMGAPSPVFAAPISRC